MKQGDSRTLDGANLLWLMAAKNSVNLAEESFVPVDHRSEIMAVFALLKLANYFSDPVHLPSAGPIVRSQSFRASAFPGTASSRPDMNLDQTLQTFIAESRLLLDEMEAGLLDVDTSSQAVQPADKLRTIFQAARAIKTSAGRLALDDLVSFTHVVEGVLDHIRQGKFAFTEPLIALLLECTDHIRRMVEKLSDNRDGAATDPGNDLLEQLRLHLKRKLIEKRDGSQGADH